MGVALAPNAFLARTGFTAPSSFSWCGWTRIDTDRGQFTILRYLAANVVGGGGFQFTVDASRKLIVYRANAFVDLLGGAGPTLAVGDWWFLGITTIVDDIPNNVNIYRAPENATSLTQTTVSYSGQYQYGNHYIGARPGNDGQDGAFRLHGSASQDRVWQGVTLTPTEMLAEYRSRTAPVKSGAWAVWPLVSSATATTDTSGNSRPLTATTGTGSITTSGDPAQLVLGNVVAAPATIHSPRVYRASIHYRWTAGDQSQFTKQVLSEDGETVTMSIVNGRADFEATAGDSVAGGNQREVWTVANTEDINSAKALLYSGPAFGSGIIPQHGLALRQMQDGSKRRSIIVWQNVIFGFNWTIHAGVWTCNLDGTGFVNRQTSLQVTPLARSTPVSAAVRTSNVVTLTLNLNADETNPYVVGDRVNTNLADDTYDGAFIVSAITNTTITYPQTAANAGTSTGTVGKVFPYWVETRIPDPAQNIIDVRAYTEDDSTPPDWSTYDPTAGLYVQTTGAGTPMSTPDHASLDITGDITIMVDLTLPDWTPSIGNDAFAAKRSTTAGQASWLFGLNNSAPAGRPEFFWSANGSTLLSATSTAALSFTDGQRGAVAVHLDVDNGASGRTITFYTAPTINGPWTQLGSQVVQAGVTSIFNSTSPVEIGSQQAGSNSLRRIQSGARIHAVKIRPGGLTGSAPVVDFFGPNVPNGQSPLTCRAGREFTIATPGAITNTGIPELGGQAFSVNLDETSSEAVMVANPTPSRGLVGVVSAHLGTDDLSHVVYGPFTVGTIADSIIVSNALVTTTTVHQPGVSQPSGTQNVGANLLAAPASVHTPTITTGAVTVVANLLAAPATVRTPTVVPSAVGVVANVVVAPATVRTPSVITGPVTVVANHINDGTVVHSPTTINSQIIATNHLSDGTVIHSPTISVGGLTVTVPLLNAQSTVYGPVVADNRTIVVDVVLDGAVVHNPGVAVGSVTVTVPLIVAAASIHAPAARAVVAVPVLSDGVIVHNPSVSTGSVTVVANSLSSPVTLHNPAVSTGATTVQVNHINVPATVRTPTVSPVVAGQVIVGSLVTTTVIGTPSVSTGPVTIVAQTVVDAAVVHNPSVQYGVVAQRVVASTTLHAPSALQSVTVAHLVASTTVRLPTIAVGATTINMQHLSAGATVRTPAVSVGATTVVAQRILAPVVLHQPNVAQAAAGVIVPQGLSVPALVREPAVSAGAVTVVPGALVGGTSVHTPSVSVVSFVSVPKVDATTTIHQPVVTVGAIVVATHIVVAGATVFAPRVASGSTVPTVVTTTTVYSPASRVVINPAALPVPTTVHSPTIFAEQTAVVPILVTATTILIPKILGGRFYDDPNSSQVGYREDVGAIVNERNVAFTFREG